MSYTKYVKLFLRSLIKENVCLYLHGDMRGRVIIAVTEGGGGQNLDF